MDVGNWLRGLDLRQYETSFRESEIEPDVLPELTDQTSKTLGGWPQRALIRPPSRDTALSPGAGTSASVDRHKPHGAATCLRRTTHAATYAISVSTRVSSP